MNLPYIQSELLRELVGMETMLKPGSGFHISKYVNGDMRVSLYWIHEPYMNNWNIFPRKITTPDQITAEINRIWQEIPAECKKENILI